GAAAGESHIDPAVAGKLLGHIARQGAPAVDSTLLDVLSDREMEILRLVARGLSNAEIAGQLFLSQGTVRYYVSATLNKLNVTDRTQAAVLALRHGLE
ncbi:MAG TPA: response regulator transcription factor, partial [Anaerolineales bacterium]|nr:response regulator transcription factor [Anaerolineales bacterium]